MLTLQQFLALKQIATAAVACEATTEFPAEISTAQCVLESAWLTRAPGNNCFGIKATDSSEQYVYTHEFRNGKWVVERDAFETYPTLTACFDAHAALLQRGRYLAAWQQYTVDRNLNALILGIAGYYATAPDYATQVTTLAHGPNITAAIAAARGSTPVIVGPQPE